MTKKIKSESDYKEIFCPNLLYGVFIPLRMLVYQYFNILKPMPNMAQFLLYFYLKKIITKNTLQNLCFCQMI